MRVTVLSKSNQGRIKVVWAPWLKFKKGPFLYTVYEIVVNRIKVNKRTIGAREGKCLGVRRIFVQISQKILQRKWPSIKTTAFLFMLGAFFKIEALQALFLTKFPLTRTKRTKLKQTFKKNVCTLLLGAIFVKSKHIQRFCEGIHTFCPNFHRFFPDFHQIKSFGVRFHTRLLHQWNELKYLYYWNKKKLEQKKRIVN